VCTFLVLEHIKDPLAFIGQLKKRLKPNGILIIEAPDIRRYKVVNTESMLTHEHLYHYTIETLALTLSKFDMQLIDYSNKDITYGFSMIAAFKQKKNAGSKLTISGFEPLALLAQFIDVREKYRDKMTQTISDIIASKKATGQKIAVYGTGFLFNFAVEKCGLKIGDLDFSFDDTKEKAGTKIGALEIYPLKEITAHKPDVVLIFSEMFFELMKKNILAHIPEQKISVVNVHQLSTAL